MSYVPLIITVAIFSRVATEKVAELQVPKPFIEFIYPAGFRIIVPIVEWAANVTFTQIPSILYDDDTQETLYKRMVKGTFRRGGEYWIYEDFNATFRHGETIKLYFAHASHNKTIYTAEFSIRYRKPTLRAGIVSEHK